MGDLAGEAGWIGELGPPDCGFDRAIPSQRCSPSPHSEATVPGHELGGIRCGPAPAREPHDLVHCGSDCRLAGRAAPNTRRPAALLSPGDQNGANATSGVPLGLASDGGLIGSILRLLGLDLAVPDYSTLSRRAETLEVPRLCSRSRGPVHLLVDSTDLRLCGPGEWLIEKHGAQRRRAWRKLHIGVDAGTGQILASEDASPCARSDPSLRHRRGRSC